MLRLLFHQKMIYIHEVGLHATPMVESDSLSGVIETGRSWYRSTERCESLIRCLQATKEYLDQFLAIRLEFISRVTMPGFLHLIYAVLILGIFATDCDAPQLDGSHIRQIADFENYINSLSNKTRQVIAMTPHVDSTREHMQNLHHLWHSSRIEYQFNDGRDLSFMDIFTTIIKRCSSTPILCEEGADRWDLQVCD